MIKAILFDMDGVVIDSEHLYEKAENNLFASYGISISDEELKELKGTTEADFYNRLEKRHRPHWDRQKVINKGRKLLLELFARDLKFMPGFTSLMNRIQGRYLTGLVTSTQRHLFEKICRILPLGDMFQEIVCADDILNGKPHPEPYLIMMKRLQVFPKEVVAIEDSLHGIASAKASGALCIALEDSFSQDELQAADKVVKSLDEIHGNLIEALARQRDSLRAGTQIH